MLDKEMYFSKEDNVFKEIKNFPPETYFKAPEVKATPSENSAKGGEIGMTGEPSKKRKKKGKRDFDNEIERSSGATESASGSVGGTAIGTAAAGGVSVAATALAATVVAISGLITPAPDYNIQRLEAGYNYVEYELYLEEIDEEMDYFVSVTHKNEEYVQELDEGLNENVIENLQPNKAYVFSIKGEDAEGTSTVTYYQTTVYTTNIMTDGDGESVDPEPDSYVSSFNENVTEEVEVFWDEGGFNRIVFPVYFEKQADGECLRIVASDGNGTEYARVDCDGQTAELNVPVSAVEVSIEYQKVRKLDDQEKIYEALDGGALDLDFGITISEDFRVIGYNYGEVFIDFNKLNGTFVSAVVVYDYGDGEIGREILSEDLEQGQYVIDVYNDGSEVLSVTAEIEVEGPYGGNSRGLVIEKTYTLEPVFEVKGIEYQLASYPEEAENYVSFDINFWGDESTAKVKVREADDDATTTEYSLGKVRFKYERSTAQTYQYRLMDGDKELTDWVEFVVDPNVKDENITYNFSNCSINPGDILITYNTDGTVNFYVPLRFSCDDPDVLYDVILDGEICYTGREYCCAIENMPEDAYGFNVTIYKLVGGVKHTLYKVYPSGAVGEQSFFGYVTLTNGDSNSTITVEIIVDNNYMYDYDSFVITAGGKTYTVSAADFVEEGYYKVCTFTIPEVVESATVTFYANSTAYYYEELAAEIEFKGELYTKQVIEVTVE